MHPATVLVFEMSRQEQHRLTDQIDHLKKVIKQKYQNFKQGRVESNLMLEKQYKPLIKEIRKSGKLSVKEEPRETEPEEEPEEEPESQYFKPQTFSSPQKPSLEEVFESPQEDVLSRLSTSEGQQNASQFVESTFNDPMTRKYMLKLMKDLGGAKSKIDHTFGPHYDNNALKIGNKTLDFNDDGSILVGSVSYKPTVGLYELVFKRLPDDQLYDADDLKAYKDILLKSQAHKRGYKNTATVNRDNSLKYKSVIANLFPKSYSGKGMTKSYGRDLKYWDDPNELCDRLRLLVTSVEAGNNNHKNEIINIVEELKEAHYITGSGNARFRSLLK